MIVADVDGVLHFRQFDGHGKVILDTNTTKWPKQVTEFLWDQIKNATARYGSAKPWNSLQLELFEKFRIMDAVVSMIDPAWSTPGLGRSRMFFWGIGGDYDGLAVKYVRVKTGGPTSDTVTVICIAGLSGWWQAPDVHSAGRDEGWRTLGDDESHSAILFPQLIRLLKRAKGVAGWIDP